VPNYAIPSFIREHLKTRALNLSATPLSYALADFPLTTAQVQYLVTPADQVSRMRQLISEGIQTIERHAQIRVAFLRDRLPGLKRSIVLSMQLPERIVVGKSTQWHVPLTKFDVSEGHYLVPDNTTLDKDDRESLVRWLERALRQQRLYEITEACVKDLLMNAQMSPTSSHLRALWPTLCKLVEVPTGGYRTDIDRTKLWQERFRNPTRSLRSYQPSPEVKDRYAKLLVAADMAISAGLVMDAYQQPAGVIHCDIEHWERLPGDIRFPLPKP
jgi:hypothetical protein